MYALALAALLAAGPSSDVVASHGPPAIAFGGALAGAVAGGLAGFMVGAGVPLNLALGSCRAPAVCTTPPAGYWIAPLTGAAGGLLGVLGGGVAGFVTGNAVAESAR